MRSQGTHHKTGEGGASGGCAFLKGSRSSRNDIVQMLHDKTLGEALKKENIRGLAHDMREGCPFDGASTERNGIRWQSKIHAYAFHIDCSNAGCKNNKNHNTLFMNKCLHDCADPMSAYIAHKVMSEIRKIENGH